MMSKSGHRAVSDLHSARERLIELTEGLMGFRSEVVSLVTGRFGLEEPVQTEAGDGSQDVSEWCSQLDWTLRESFDPVLRLLLGLAGGPSSVVLETVLDLAVLKHRLQHLAAGLPPSALEEAMKAGDVEPERPMDLRLTIGTVILHYFDEAADMLLEAVGVSPL
jgi:hypothetical protein